MTLLSLPLNPPGHQSLISWQNTLNAISGDRSTQIDLRIVISSIPPLALRSADVRPPFNLCTSRILWLGYAPLSPLLALGVTFECLQCGIPKMADLLEHTDQFVDRLLA